VQVQVDCTQRLDRGPRGGVAGRHNTSLEGSGCRGPHLPACSRPHRRTTKALVRPPKDDGSGDSRTWSRPTPAHRRRLGTKWEPRVLARALHSSIPPTCALVHLRKYGPDLMARISMHGWGQGITGSMLSVRLVDGRLHSASNGLDVRALSQMAPATPYRS
jgi:hypothetical protein